MIQDETFRQIANETVPPMRQAIADFGMEGLVQPSMSMTAKVLLNDGTWANVRVTVELDPEPESEEDFEQAELD